MPLDDFIKGFDRALRTVTGVQTAKRPSPARHHSSDGLQDQDRAHVAGLMRVNHTGEICAQALYEGQALTARDARTKDQLRAAADDERDHLLWCRERLAELDAKPSVLDPLWYVASFSLGAVVGLMGDKTSLGFVAATEDRVVKHLLDHESQLPAEDQRTRALLEQMRIDEQQHGEHAMSQGGAAFSEPVKQVMAGVAQVMTTISYRI